MDSPRTEKDIHRQNVFGGIRRTFMMKHVFDAKLEEFRSDVVACDRSSCTVSWKIVNGSKRFENKDEDTLYAHSVWWQR